jgi:hypothetical protein
VIGTYTTPHGVTARLNGELSWESDDSDLEGFLNLMWPGGQYSPADGVPGWAMLAEAQAALGGKAEILGQSKYVQENPPPDTDY